MKLWVGGEMGPWPEGLGQDIEQQQRSIRRRAIKPLEEYLADRDYGSDLKTLYVIPMTFRPDIELYNERKLFRPGKKDADYRLKIDYDDFVNASEEGKEKLILQNIIQCVRLVGDKMKKKRLEFDAQKMEREIRDFVQFHEPVENYLASNPPDSTGD